MGRIYKITLKDPSVAEKLPHIFPGSGKAFYISAANHKRLIEEKIAFSVLGEIDTDALTNHIVYPFKNFLYSTPTAGAVEEIFAKLHAVSDGGVLKYAVYTGRSIPPDPDSFYMDALGGQRRYQWKIIDRREQEISLADTFPHLIRRIQDSNTRVVASFGAGGLRFFAHGSAMKFFNATGISEHIDEVWGTGGGAFSAYGFARGVPPEVFEQKGYDLYREQYRYDHATLRGRIRSWLKILSAQFNSDLLKRYSDHILKMHMIISQLVSQRPLVIPFYCVAHNTKRGHNEVFSPVPQEITSAEDFIHHIDPIESIIAMSCIPLVHTPESLRKSMDSGFYMDGSIAEDTSLFSIYKKWKLDRTQRREKRERLLIISLNTFPQMAKNEWFMRRYVDRILPLNLYRALMQISDIVITARYHEHAEILSSMAGVEILRINFPLETSSFLDGRVIPTIIQNAQTSLLKELQSVEYKLAEAERLSSASGYR